MAILAAFRTLFESTAAELVVKAAKIAIAQLPWAKDQRKTQYVERKIALLVGSASELARNLVPGSAEPQMERLLSSFKEDLIDEGITGPDAELVTESVRAQIRTTVLLPLEDLYGIQSRLEVLEKENLSLEKKIKRQDEQWLAAEQNRDFMYKVYVIAVSSAIVASIALLLAVRLYFR